MPIPHATLVAPSGPELRITVEILRIPGFYDRNALPPEHFQGGNCLSDSAFFSEIPSDFVALVD